MRGLYLNSEAVDAHRKIQPEDLIDGRLVIVRAGKDRHAVFTTQSEHSSPHQWAPRHKNTFVTIDMHATMVGDNLRGIQ